VSKEKRRKRMKIDLWDIHSKERGEEMTVKQVGEGHKGRISVHIEQ
jgi:hypothetical protein